MRWLNRNIFELGVVSLLSDFSHEMATVVLPSFVISIGGSPAILGVIEGVADASISFMKLFAGWYSDVIGKRKPFAVIGYALTGVGVGILAVSYSWYQVLFGRVTAWAGKGLRKPPRDALLVESTQPQFYGRVFGFHRAMDTVGGILGPLVAYVLIAHVSYRAIFLYALIPSILAVIIMMMVKEVRRITPKKEMHFTAELKHMPRNFYILLSATTFFALGKFADSMIILRVTQMLTPQFGVVGATSYAILFYTLRNIFYALASYPLGALGDRIGKRRVLVVGYILAACAALGFGCACPSMFMLGALCALAGLSLAMTDATEKSVAADFIPGDVLATGYGILAFTGGIAAFLSSSMVGLLWTYGSPMIGFGYSAVLSLLGAVVLVFGVGFRPRTTNGL